MTTYGPTMAAGYDRGRRLRAEDVGKWMTAARPYLPEDGGRVLDLGAGTGRFSDALALSCGAMVVACEPSPAMRSVCRSRCSVAVVVGGGAEAAPFRSNVFDAVWASQVLHHIRDLPAFAANTRRVLRRTGYLLLRGGFGPVEELPLYPYFPTAWAADNDVRLSLDRIRSVLADADLEMVDRVQIEQVFAESSDELTEKVQLRSLSNFAGLSELAFHEGLRALRQDVADGIIAGPVLERLDLVVFGRSSRA
jgi:SAM-dependent methyltransferase